MKAILAALFLRVTLAGVAQEQQPNIVVFLSDDHSLFDSTAYGSKDVKTPAMERLANAGMTFDRAFVRQGPTLPAHRRLRIRSLRARHVSRRRGDPEWDQVAAGTIRRS